VSGFLTKEVHGGNTVYPLLEIVPKPTERLKERRGS